MTDGPELHDAIHESDGVSATTEDRGEVHGDGRFARSTFWRETDDHPPLEPDVALADGECGRELVGPAWQDEDCVDALIGLWIDRTLRDRDHDDPRAG